jgi:hypothetical protein
MNNIFDSTKERPHIPSAYNSPFSSTPEIIP